jgi:hypothetical protein
MGANVLTGTLMPLVIESLKPYFAVLVDAYNLFICVCAKSK